MVRADAAGHHVETRVVARQRHRVALRESDVLDPRRGGHGPRLLEHRGREIDRHHLRHPRGERHGRVARARANIEHALITAQARGIHHQGQIGASLVERTCGVALGGGAELPLNGIALLHGPSSLPGTPADPIHLINDNRIFILLK